MILHRPCLEKNLESKRFRKKNQNIKLLFGVWRLTVHLNPNPNSRGAFQTFHKIVY